MHKDPEVIYLNPDYLIPYILTYHSLLSFNVMSILFSLILMDWDSYKFK